MISSRHLQKALEHYYETHEPKWAKKQLWVYNKESNGLRKYEA